MKSVLFHYSVFNRGGAEKSTLKLMKLFLKKGWKVKLVLNFRGGGMEEDIPAEVEVEYLSRFHIASYRNKFVRYILKSIDLLTNPFVFMKYKKECYDLACVGLQGLSPRFVCKIVDAKRRITFIRNDISLCEKQEKIILGIKKYEKNLDQIICVSKTAKESVDLLIPSCMEKTKVVYNVLDVNEMKKQLEISENPFRESIYLKVVSVCRMVDKAKGLFRMLEAYERLYEKGIVFEWYFVGDGVDLPRMKKIVENKPYRKFIHFEGEKKNPFPYYKYADLVAVLSYYEGLCGIVNEAKVSGAAVIATEFSGIHEQLIHGKNGWIVENNLEGIVKGMEEILTNTLMREVIRNSTYPNAILNDDDKINQILG